MRICDRKPQQRYEIKKIDQDTNIYYTNYQYPAIVWKNIYIFIFLHAINVYGIYLALYTITWASWSFMSFWAVLGGLGITAGAHRLWSHRSYKAKYPLRFFLMLCNCIAGQNDLIEWCRDHRLHHKYSETDADPHNSNRGWFFAHIGWLLQRKHPKVIEYGSRIDLKDLKEDPVLVFQRRFYWPLALILNLVLPTVICCFFGDGMYDALSVSVWRYTTALHCTWFVNSAAHVWGNQDYDKNISPRESIYVSLGALGEGFHNYHHTFPFDYSTSEHGGYFNFTTMFIDLMSFLGLAYDLKSVNKNIVNARKLRTGTVSQQKNSTGFSLFRKIGFWWIFARWHLTDSASN